MKNLLVIGLLLASLSLSVAQKSTTSFIFGHSLLDHRPPAIPTPSNETTVPHWIYLLSQEAGHQYKAAGKYGFLPQHADLPPFSQWGYDIVPPAWESDMEPFSDADFTEIILTAGNFMQWQPCYAPYPNGGGQSPLSATYEIVDWVNDQEDSVRMYVYENWPDMAPYLSDGFPPTRSDMQKYHDYTEGEFHDWWIEYHDSLLTYRPDLEVRMIPVGPIIARLLQTDQLENIPYDELYEDDAPHGRASIYFLASLVTYMATYEEKAPSTYNVPSIIYEDIRDHYDFIVNQIWDELVSFNLSNGDSRVFFDRMTTSSEERFNIPQWICSPNPARDHIQIEGQKDWSSVTIWDTQGRKVRQIQRTSDRIDISALESGIYHATFQKDEKQVGYAEWIIQR